MVKKNVDANPSLQYLEKVLRQNKGNRGLIRCSLYRDKIGQFVLGDLGRKMLIADSGTKRISVH
ncbi:hypothetical protein [Heliophilum fasciatum]|uniref:hypothetical protein n=1 Tax=Heliophilum fasciatum TaxID=35700 RepID=UPI001047BAC5|nr:hypothetical protein [Heliophilum fasciatum]MCW2277552.1 hypothetical protein [Heliophilum fasciatum]